MKLRGMVATLTLIGAMTLTACGNDTIDQSLATGVTAASIPDSGDGTGENRPGSGTGNGTGTDASNAAEQATDTAGTTTTGGANGAPASNALTLSISNTPDQPLYSQGVMQAPIGSQIIVEYNNPSQQPHNWVLVEPGQEQAVVDAAEAKNGDPSGLPGVIAWSETIAGSTTRIEVPALTQEGGYPYICTVPGHYEAGHKGALNVR